MKRLLLAALAAAAVLATWALPTQAGTIVDDWAGIQRPAAPKLKAVKADAKTTALLMLDFMHQNCGKREACVASLPAVKKLLAAARAANATVIYSTIPHTTAKMCSMRWRRRPAKRT